MRQATQRVAFRASGHWQVCDKCAQAVRAWDAKRENSTIHRPRQGNFDLAKNDL